MSEIEKLRALLAEALPIVESVGLLCNELREVKRENVLAHSIKSALAEPVGALHDCICTGPWVTGHQHTDICREFRAMRAECVRQTEYGIKQHEVAQDCIREAQKWKKERDEARAQLDTAVKAMVKEANECAQLRNERDEARAEVERLSTWGPLRRLHTEMEAEVKAAYQRGAAAMRKAAVTRCDEMAADFRRRRTRNDEFKGMGAELCAAAIETVKGLPDPEDNP